MPNKHFNEDGLDYRLFTPGPVEVPDWVLKEMSMPNDTHRSLAYREMHAEIRENIQKILHTKNDILLFANSGSGILEACVRNLLAEDDTGLFFSCGAFGDRWIDIAERNGKKHEDVKVEYGQGITPEIVKAKLAENSYPVVFITLNETSTGVLNPLDKIGPIVKESGALLCVDCVSGMAGTLLKVDEWGIDVALASVQKCFGIPPGLALCSISDRTLEKASTVKNRGFYFDFIKIQKKGLKNEHPITPCIPQIRALKKVSAKILEITPEKFAQQHFERTEMIRNWAKNHGFEIFSPEGYHSQTVVTIKNNLNIDVGKFVDELFNRGYKIVNGYGNMKGQNFRMAPMAWVTKEDTEKMLKAADEALKAAK
jgi:aspartate aminotransferase-like enzyme